MCGTSTRPLGPAVRESTAKDSPGRRYHCVELAPDPWDQPRRSAGALNCSPDQTGSQYLEILKINFNYFIIKSIKILNNNLPRVKAA